MTRPQPAPMHCYIRSRKPDGTECKINLLDLEDALNDVFPGTAYLLPETGRIVFRADSDYVDDEEPEGEDEKIPDDAEVLDLDPLPSRVRFQWMEEFSESVHSITLRASLGRALRQSKPSRNFKDALMEYPDERERWFQFQADKLTAEAVALIESFDWEILEVVDQRPRKVVSQEIELAERLPLTAEESEWILRGGWQVATSGGRTQLVLLLKGSKNKDLLKHNLQTSPAYGKLSFLTLEEIENRIDQVIRKGDLAVQFFSDLPLIVLTKEGWERVRPWAHQYECEQALAADNKILSGILAGWRNRPRDEQFELVECMASLNSEASQRVLETWREVAGKEVRSRIEAKLQR